MTISRAHEPLDKISPWAFGEICRFRTLLADHSLDTLLDTAEAIGHVPIPHPHYLPPARSEAEANARIAANNAAKAVQNRTESEIEAERWEI